MLEFRQILPRHGWKSRRAQSLLALGAALFAALPVQAAPPSFDAGALLEQLNRETFPKPANPSLPVETQSFELFTAFEFRGLPERLVPVATDFLKPYVGKEVRMGALITLLYAHLQKRNPKDNFIFIPKKVGPVYLLIAQKVAFDGVTIQANRTRSRDAFLTSIMSYKLLPETELDYSQIERNATVMSELPGIVSQFNMKPGSLPGSSNVHLFADQGSAYSGSATLDNSGTRSLGVSTLRADVAAYNRLGWADTVRLNGQLSNSSQSVGIDASSVVHPSGLRSGVNHSTFRYGYSSEVQGSAAGNPQRTDSRYTGASSISGLNLTYPRIRTDEARQNLTLDLNYNRSSSDVGISQQTRILGVDEQLYNSSAQYRLSDLLIRKASFGVNGARALNIGATLNYQVAAVLGKASQRLADATVQDYSGEQSLRTFAKATAAMQFTKSFSIAGIPYEGLLSSELQVTRRNLASPEKAYLGGMYRMQAWSPQSIGGQQFLYVKAQVMHAVPSVPGMGVGFFAELAHIQLSTHNYTTSVGTQTVAVDTDWQTLSDFGIMVSLTPRPNISLSAAVAKKLSNDPVVVGARIHNEGDVRGWVSARISF